MVYRCDFYSDEDYELAMQQELEEYREWLEKEEAYAKYCEEYYEEQRLRKASMKWNVYYYNVNKNKIEIFNIFDHYSFKNEIDKLLNECQTIEDFKIKAKSPLRYYYWSKCEWEVIVSVNKDKVFLTPWCGCKNPEEITIEVTSDWWKEFANLHISKQRFSNEAKIDVFDQVMFEWDRFIEYVWKNRIY